MSGSSTTRFISFALTLARFDSDTLSHYFTRFCCQAYDGARLRKVENGQDEEAGEAGELSSRGKIQTRSFCLQSRDGLKSLTFRVSRRWEAFFTSSGIAISIARYMHLGLQESLTASSTSSPRVAVLQVYVLFSIFSFRHISVHDPMEKNFLYSLEIEFINSNGITIHKYSYYIRNTLINPSLIVSSVFFLYLDDYSFILLGGGGIFSPNDAYLIPEAKWHSSRC